MTETRWSSASSLTIHVKHGKLLLRDDRSGQLVRGNVSGWGLYMQKAGELSIRLRIDEGEEADGGDHH
jgi:hypothetical protein